MQCTHLFPLFFVTPIPGILQVFVWMEDASLVVHSIDLVLLMMPSFCVLCDALFLCVCVVMPCYCVVDFDHLSETVNQILVVRVVAK
jgi:hypothetical protein